MNQQDAQTDTYRQITEAVVCQVNASSACVPKRAAETGLDSRKEVQ